MLRFASLTKPLNWVWSLSVVHRSWSQSCLLDQECLSCTCRSSRWTTWHLWAPLWERQLPFVTLALLCWSWTSGFPVFVAYPALSLVYYSISLCVQPCFLIIFFLVVDFAFPVEINISFFFLHCLIASLLFHRRLVSFYSCVASSSSSVIGNSGVLCYRCGS